MREVCPSIHIFQSHLNDYSELTEFVTQVLSNDPLQSVHTDISVSEASGSVQVISVDPPGTSSVNLQTISVSEASGSVQVISVDPPATSSVNLQIILVGEASGSVQPIGIDPSAVQSQTIQEQSADT